MEQNRSRLLGAGENMIAQMGKAAGVGRVWCQNTLSTLRQHWLAAGRSYRKLKRKSSPALSAGLPFAAESDFLESIFQRSVEPRLLALAKLRTAARLGCEITVELRAQVCRRYGWPADQVNAVRDGLPHPQFSRRENLLLRYADDITRTPTDVDLKLSRELREYFSPEQLAEITATICYENFRTRYKNALGIERELEMQTLSEVNLQSTLDEHCSYQVQY